MTITEQGARKPTDVERSLSVYLIARYAARALTSAFFASNFFCCRSIFFSCSSGVARFRCFLLIKPPKIVYHAS